MSVSPIAISAIAIYLSLAVSYSIHFHIKRGGEAYSLPWLMLQPVITAILLPIFLWIDFRDLSKRKPLSAKRRRIEGRITVIEAELSDARLELNEVSAATFDEARFSLLLHRLLNAETRLAIEERRLDRNAMKLRQVGYPAKALPPIMFGEDAEYRTVLNFRKLWFDEVNPPAIEFEQDLELTLGLRDPLRWEVQDREPSQDSLGWLDAPTRGHQGSPPTPEWFEEWRAFVSEAFRQDVLGLAERHAARIIRAVEEIAATGPAWTVENGIQMTGVRHARLAYDGEVFLMSYAVISEEFFVALLRCSVADLLTRTG